MLHIQLSSNQYQVDYNVQMMKMSEVKFKKSIWPIIDFILFMGG